MRRTEYSWRWSPVSVGVACCDGDRGGIGPRREVILQTTAIQPTRMAADRRQPLRRDELRRVQYARTKPRPVPRATCGGSTPAISRSRPANGSDTTTAADAYLLKSRRSGRGPRSTPAGPGRHADQACVRGARRRRHSRWRKSVVDGLAPATTFPVLHPS